MWIEDLKIEGVKKVHLKVFEDERGCFMQTYQKNLYQNLGLGEFVQDNQSLSCYGVIRGMHFQQKPGQAKLISVLKGKIWDVFIDIRKNSPTYLQFGAELLCPNSHFQLFLPVGIAHGFCSLEDETLVSYKVSSYFDPEQEKGFRFDDPLFNIPWPLNNPIVSFKDKNAPFFKELFDV